MVIADSNNNDFVGIINTSLEMALSYTGLENQSFSQLSDALMERYERYKKLGAGKTLQTYVAVFFDNNKNFIHVMFGNDEDACGDLLQQVISSCPELADPIID